MYRHAVAIISTCTLQHQQHVLTLRNCIFVDHFNIALFLNHGRCVCFDVLHGPTSDACAVHMLMYAHTHTQIYFTSEELGGMCLHISHFHTFIVGNRSLFGVIFNGWKSYTDVKRTEKLLYAQAALSSCVFLKGWSLYWHILVMCLCTL